MKLRTLYHKSLVRIENRMPLQHAFYSTHNQTAIMPKKTKWMKTQEGPKPHRLMTLYYIIQNVSHLTVIPSLHSFFIRMIFRILYFESKRKGSLIERTSSFPVSRKTRLLRKKEVPLTIKNVQEMFTQCPTSHSLLSFYLIFRENGIRYTMILLVTVGG